MIYSVLALQNSAYNAVLQQPIPCDAEMQPVDPILYNTGK